MPPADPAPDAEPTPGSEAAKYRVRLREAESQRDALGSRLEQLQRGEVARLAGVRLAVGADLFDVGAAKLPDLLREDGTVDDKAVAAAVGALLKARPGLSRDARPAPLNMGQGNRPGVAESGATWHGLLRPNRG